MKFHSRNLLAILKATILHHSKKPNLIHLNARNSQCLTMKVCPINCLEGLQTHFLSLQWRKLMQNKKRKPKWWKFWTKVAMRNTIKRVSFLSKRCQMFYLMISKKSKARTTKLNLELSLLKFLRKILTKVSQPLKRQNRMKKIKRISLLIDVKILILQDSSQRQFLKKMRPKKNSSIHNSVREVQLPLKSQITKTRIWWIIMAMKYSKKTREELMSNHQK